MFVIFKFIKESQSFVNSMALTLQGMESKTLYVMFSPNSIGASTGKIIFSHYNLSKNGQNSNDLQKAVC